MEELCCVDLKPDVIISESEPKVIIENDKEIIIITDNEPIYIIETKEGPQGPQGLQGPQGPKGDPGICDQKPVRKILSPNETQIIDTYKSLEYRTIKWLVTITNKTKKLYRTFEVLALNKNTSCFHTVYGIIGDVIDYTVDVELDLINNNIILSITNLENDPIIVDTVTISSVLLT